MSFQKGFHSNVKDSILEEIALISKWYPFIFHTKCVSPALHRTLFVSPLDQKRWSYFTQGVL